VATINTNLTVSAPPDIDVPLVRADELAAGSIFRIFFEICLTAAGVIAGSMLCEQVVGIEEKAIFILLVVLSIISLVASLVPGKLANLLYPRRPGGSDAHAEQD
jgi:hypothetical protein